MRARIRRSSSLATSTSAGRARSRISALASAMASGEAKNPRWASPTLVQTRTSGSAMATRVRISPGWFMPSSTTATCGRVPQLEQRQRQADVVVEVPLVPEHRVARRQELRRHFLRRRLAGAAGDRDDTGAGPPPHLPGQRLQRAGRVVDPHQHRRAGVRRRTTERLLHDRGGGPLLERLGDEGVAVEPVAADGDEQVSRLDRPRVDGDAPHELRGVAMDQAPAGGSHDIPGGDRQRLQGLRHLRRGPAPSQRRSRNVHVVERQRAIADHLVTLVPLAGDEHQVARRGPRDRGLDRRLAVDDGEERRGARPLLPLRRHRSAGITMPRLISSMICSGSSLRGLSEVMTTRSLSRAATAPISGRLLRSRSPPQPNTVMSRPVASGRAVSSRFLSASSVCA